MAVMELMHHMHFAWERLPLLLRVRSLKIFTPKVAINFSNQHYQVKTITSPAELMEVLKLRYDVFFREFFQGKNTFEFLSYDVDVHDLLCDHLVVRKINSDKIIACYRLRSSEEDPDHGTRFYSEGEFDLKSFLRLPGKKLELGRACVHKDYRDGAVVSLLWKGLCEYAKKSDSRYMFGCSSIAESEFSKVPEILRELEQRQAFIEDYSIPVQPAYKLPARVEPERPVQGEAAGGGRAISSLMHMYLLAGAKMGRELAFDREMNCYDLITIVDFRNLPPSFERRFTC